ncbi:hypothetical protein ANN_06395 [Periplaneta americana]|uniref:Uncharacterized protein n=1 Tax=Periplaneta americana TaxID=6978 RepID=A0ABQ8TE55_PERAM|nr:hypothetical protein ANN_06395 [Periplaneta americana]
MAGLCEGGNEPAGSLKAICNLYLFVAIDMAIAAFENITGKTDLINVLTVADNLRLGQASPLSYAKGCSAHEEPRPTSRLASRSHAEAKMDDHPTRMEEKEKELAESLVEKKLASEGYTGRNGEQEKSSGQKMIPDDRRH